MSPRHITLAILLAAALFLAGCAGSISDQPVQIEDQSTPGAVEKESEPEPAAPSETPDRSEQRPAQTPPPDLERVKITPPAPVTGEVPAEILEAILADLAERTGTKSEDIVVVRAETAVWNDSALGCPKTGEVYIQVLIDGYWVVLEVKGVEYDYRVSNKGSFKLCQGILSETPDINQPLDGYGTIDDPHPLLPIISGKTVKCKWPPCQ